jgi:hypothetical protein
MSAIVSGKYVLPLLSLVILASASGVAYAVHWLAVSTQTISAQAVANDLLPLILVALFSERAVEVIISPWRDLDATKLANNLKTAQGTSGAVLTQQTAQNSLDEYRGETRQYAFILLLCFGLAAAMAGVRAVQPLFQVSAQSPSGIQSSVFGTVDVLITALMLAGGANGIHSISTMFLSFLDATTDRINHPPQTS